MRKRVAPVVHGAMYGTELTGGNADWVSSRCMPVIALLTAQKSSVGWRLLPRPIPQIFSNNSAAHPPCRRHRQSARSSRATHQRCSRNIAMILNGHFRWPSIDPTLRQGKPTGSPGRQSAASRFETVSAVTGRPLRLPTGQASRDRGGKPLTRRRSANENPIANHHGSGARGRREPPTRNGAGTEHPGSASGMLGAQEGSDQSGLRGILAALAAGGNVSARVSPRS